MYAGGLFHYNKDSATYGVCREGVPLFQDEEDNPLINDLGIYILDVIALYFCNNLYLLYFLLFAGGISETGRYYVAYVYVVEMMPKKAQDKAGLYIFMVFGLAMAYIGL